MGFSCVWTNHKTGDQCQATAALVNHIPLCITHELDHRSSRSATARQSAEHHPRESFPGFCYFALLPDGNIKIGYSNTEELLKKRMRDLRPQPAIQLLILPGGFITEAVMHEKFKHLRHPGPGELFSYTPEMAEFILEEHKKK